MSLFLDERIEEQIIDPVNDQITFTYPWIIAIPLTTEAVAADDDGIRITNRFGTNYENGEAGWFGMLSTDKIGIHSITSYHNGNGSFRVWNGTCFISYILYSTEELHSEFYSSPKISMIPTPNRDSFKTPDGAMTKFAEAYVQKKLTKIIVFIELLLPAKFFYRPFERNSMFLKHKHCFDFPDNFEDDFRFDFLNKSDFKIICSDGIMPCNRMALYLSSKFMKKYLTETKSIEFVTTHLLDVINPVITFLHSSCFKMPKLYNLDFAKRLLKVINFLNPQEKYKITGAIHQSLCKKFVTESHDFNSILRWASVACQYSLSELQNMIASLIVNKYYFKWHETFPEIARNTGNELFLEIFGYDNEENDIFEDIDDIYQAGILTNVILS